MQFQISDLSVAVTRTTPNNVPTLELARKTNGGHSSFLLVSASVVVFATLDPFLYMAALLTLSHTVRSGATPKMA